MTTLNLLIITIAAGFSLRLCTTASWGQTIATILVLAALTAGALYTTLRIGSTYDTRLRQAVELPAPVKKS